MSYYLTTFCGVDLPLAMAQTRLPTATPADGAVKTLSGGFDAFGSAVAPVRWPLTLSFVALVVEEDAADFVDAVATLRGLARQRGDLVRTGEDGSTQTCTARLLSVQMEDSPETRTTLQVTLTFQQWSHWGGAPVIATATLADASTLVGLNNEGQLAVDDPIITVTAGADYVDYPIFLLGTSELRFSTLRILAGETLTIDCGARSITVDGVSVYSKLAYGSAHAQAEWMLIPAGGGTLTVSRAAGHGADAVVVVRYTERWA